MLQEASYDMTAVAFTHNKEAEADKALYVLFYVDAVPNTQKSDDAGRLICEQKDFVMIMVPGDKHSIIRRPVQPRDIQRFQERYRAFKAGQAQETVSGTPLHMVPWLDKAQIMELKYLGCHTLENLAGMPDSTAQKFMQLQKLKQQAKDAIQAAKDAAPLLTLRSEIDKKDQELSVLNTAQAELKAQLAAQSAQIQQLQNAILNSSMAQMQPQVPAEVLGARGATRK